MPAIHKDELLLVPNHDKPGRPRKAAAPAALPSLLDIQRAKYRRSFYEFYKAAYANVLEPASRYLDNWHIEYLCDLLQAEAERIAAGIPKSQDIIINIPFRASKSLICTVAFPVWCWIAAAHLRFITASYSASLSLGLGTQSRDLIVSSWFQTLFPDLSLKADNNAKGEFENTKTGKRISTSLGGTVTGRGANILIIDDPMKPDDASSDANLLAVQEWYDGTMYNRLNDFEVDVRIIVMQRLAEKDLCGYLLEKSPDEYRHICLPATDEDPAIIKPAELITRYQDGLFWSNRFTRKALATFLKAMGSRKYANQLMQKALPLDGGMFKRDWFSIISAEEFRTNRLQGRSIEWKVFVDPAETEKKQNDPSGLLLCGILGNHLYIKDASGVRMELPALVRHVRSYVETHGHSGTRIYIEGKSSGKSLIAQLKEQTFYSIQEVQPGRESKAARAEAATPFAESRRVTLVQGSWNEAFLDQVTSFTDGKSGHDEWVDLLGYAIKICKQSDFFYAPV